MTESIGVRLAEARYKKGWSRRRVIEAADKRLTETALRNIEKGYSKPLPQTVYILAAALELDAKDLLDGVAS